MKRNLAVVILSLFSLAIPQLASAGQAANYPGHNQSTYYNDGRYYQAAPWGNRPPVDDRQQYGRGWHDRSDYRNGYYGDRGYYGGRDDDRYYYERNRHAGRSAAIIGGSAAAGAVLGAAAGSGKGAAIGAIVGGVAGVVADQAVRHHDRDRW